MVDYVFGTTNGEILLDYEVFPTTLLFEFKLERGLTGRTAPTRAGHSC